MAMLALGGQVAMASEAVDRAAGLLGARVPVGGIVLCGSRFRLHAAVPSHPKQRAVVRAVGVMPASGDVDDLLAPDHPALFRPEPGFIRLAGRGLGPRSPATVGGIRPYPRGPPVLG